MKTSLTLIAMTLALAACIQPSSDKVQQEQQERILAEGTAQTGMPAISNFRERRLLKMIYELRDKEGLTTFTYTVNREGRLNFLCASHGYPISDATGYTNPEKLISGGSYATMPQAEPNGLFTPDASTANWVICLGPDGKAVPVFVQTEIAVAPFKLAPY